MEITRDRFVEQFAITLSVQCLRLWPHRAKAPPLHLAICFRQWICTAAGDVAGGEAAFAAATEPVIERLWQQTPRGQQPAGRLIAGLLYDALSAAAIEVTIRPPLAMHSTSGPSAM